MTDDQFETSPPDEEQSASPEPTIVPEPGFPWVALIAIAGISLTVVFAVQNTELVPVHFLWLDGEHPLALVILITVAVTVLIAALVGFSYRRRRKRRMVEQQELKRYREST